MCDLFAFLALVEKTLIKDWDSEEDEFWNDWE